MYQVVFDEKVLTEVVRRLVEAVHPARIILFGSRARGDARDDSDVDLLLIGDADRPELQEALAYEALSGLALPAEILWYTPQQVEEWADVRNHLISRALREGRILYERQLEARAEPDLAR